MDKTTRQIDATLDAESIEIEYGRAIAKGMTIHDFLIEGETEYLRMLVRSPGFVTSKKGRFIMRRVMKLQHLRGIL